jgi:signal transduction histidine kinase
MQPLKSHFSTIAAFILLMFLMAAWSIGTWIVIDKYQEEHLDRTETTVELSASIFAEHSGSVLGRLDELSLEARDQWTSSRGRKATDGYQHTIAAGKHSGLVFRLAIFDRHGQQLFGTLRGFDKNENFSDRPYFFQAKEAGQSNLDSLIVGAPFLGALTGKQIFPLSRPIFRVGEFDGVLLISIEPDVFKSFAIAQASSNQQGVVALVSDNGDVIFRHPPLNPDKNRLSVPQSKPYFDLPRESEGHFVHIAISDGEKRLAGFKRLSSLPLTAISSLPYSEVDEQNQKFRTKTIGISLLIGGPCIALLVGFLIHVNFLATRRRTLSQIFNALPDGVVDLDANVTVRSINSAFSIKTRISRSECIGLSLSDFLELTISKIKKDKQAESALFIRQLVNEESWHSGNIDLNHEIEMSTGSIFKLIPMPSLQDKESKLLYFHEVTDERRLRQLTSRFIARAAHELRTPLSNVIGYTDLCLADESAGDETRKALKIIKRNSHLLRDGVTKLLELSRLESIDNSEGEQWIEIGTFAENAIRDFAVPVGYKKPLLRVYSTGIRLRATTERLSAIFSNLLSNAYKFSSQEASVEVLIQRIDRNGTPFVCLKFVDSGPGMHPDFIASAGTPFHREDNVAHIEGTGLGLSIVKEHVKALHGNIVIKSELGVGTSIEMEFPGQQG